jgi:endonuclease/exonuclease/phosphatase (EEP) superfamily protein YafD
LFVWAAGGLWYNVRVRQSRDEAAWTRAGYGVGLALSGAALVRAWRPERSTIDVAVTAASPWLLAPSWVLLAGALLTRRRALGALAGGVAVFHASCVRPRPAARVVPNPDGPALSVAFANVWGHNKDVTGILRELAAGEHDIVAMAEVTEDHVPAIDALLPPSTYPWRRVDPDARQASKGLALLSRIPLGQVERWSSHGHPQLDSVVLAPGALPFRLLVVHTWGPVGRSKVRRWRAQLAEVGARAEEAPTGASASTGQLTAAGVLPTVMVGDFNATRQHRSFDRLAGPSWSDAGTRRFGGWRATWPANRRWRPALFRIDHILAGPGITVRSGRAGRASGSDHRPVTAVLGLPPAAGAPGPAEAHGP